MTTRIKITAADIINLGRLATGLVLSNKAAGKLAKLGWAEVRATKVYSREGGTSKIYRAWLTPAGSAALVSAGNGEAVKEA